MATDGTHSFTTASSSLANDAIVRSSEAKTPSNGADVAVHALAHNGVDLCFANPGTSEVHLVAALDSLQEIRTVLCLFEGVATGAADGYGRMAGKPAAVLLHLGVGLSNGIANLHNARRASSPVLVVVGEHPRTHRELDPPLNLDLRALASTVARSVHQPLKLDEINDEVALAVASANGARDAVEDASPTSGVAGSVAALILPTDVAWAPASKGAVGSSSTSSARPSAWVPGQLRNGNSIERAADMLRSGNRTLLLLGGSALDDDGLCAASRIEQATGARVFQELWPGRVRQGVGLPAITSMDYDAEINRQRLRDIEHVVLAGASLPTAWYAPQLGDSVLVPRSASVCELGHYAEQELVQLADLLAPDTSAQLVTVQANMPASGTLTRANWAAALAAHLPQNAIVCDESISAGLGTLREALTQAPPHDLLGLPGLSTGQGLPLAIGAAMACPDRPVICLEGDGSFMYTLSALWTQSREQLDITTVVLNNRAYAVLQTSLSKIGGSTVGGSGRLMDLSNPDLDFVALAAGMGVPASTATTVEELACEFRSAVASPGPHLIDARLA